MCQCEWPRVGRRRLAPVVPRRELGLRFQVSLLRVGCSAIVRAGADLQNSTQNSFSFGQTVSCRVSSVDADHPERVIIIEWNVPLQVGRAVQHEAVHNALEWPRRRWQAIPVHVRNVHQRRTKSVRDKDE